MSRFGDFIADKIANDSYFNKLFYKLVEMYSTHTISGVSYDFLSSKELKDIYQHINLLINSNSTKSRSLAYHTITLLEPFYKGSLDFKRHSSVVYYKLGLFALDINYDLLSYENIFESNIKRKINNIDDTKYYLTDAQSEIFFDMIDSKNYSFSGPTSLGKSFIISRMVERSILKSNNVIIIVPSRALINQVTQDLRRDLKILISDNDYQVKNNITGNEKNEDRYIFVLTPERLLNLHTKKN